ncbi:MAG: Na+/H+ antiporter NhaA [Solirubrobacterales bacterium]|nr:Na+/H+ antiporter NhaA [Solirubrobacterales bacterium]OJU95062.1 MAG: Na+/H+ antiporter NhaA [Solirubrobacterales bacterium 67-14]
MRHKLKTRVIDPLTDFLDDEVLGGVVLLGAAVVALAWANSPWSESYFDLWGSYLKVSFAGLTINLDLQHWINDLLMAVFFFVVGAEIKRELVSGELKDPRDASVPVIAALGGVALPAIIFTVVVRGGEAAGGWAIPAATDIAFAVGVLALLGSRVSNGVRVFLLTIAIVDDIVAILIIALFYSEGISVAWLAVAGGGILAVLLFQRLGIWRIWPYVPLAAVVWLATYESGVHATIAGVALGLLVPIRTFGVRDVHRRLEHVLHPVSAFFVVPLFALANAGIDLGGGVFGDAMGSKLTWAVILGLVVGKTLGISGSTLLALRFGPGSLPSGMRSAQVWGVGALGGIGFTVALFITDLAFADELLTGQAKIGIFLGSLVSGAIGALLLYRMRDHGRSVGD